MSNYKFDATPWQSSLTLRKPYFKNRDVNGPEQLCRILALREKAKGEIDWGEPVDVDVFVLSLGAPENPRATQLGGIPYRSRAKEWPSDEHGPLEFLAQINFSDSLDIVGPLPSDLLLIFARDTKVNATNFFFEWGDDVVEDPVGSSSVPVDCFAPCYGHIYRTHAFPAAPDPPSRISLEDSYISTRYLLNLWATQIGRAPHLVQPHLTRTPGQSLCMVKSASPSLGVEHPFLNRSAPYSGEEYEKDFNYFRLPQLGSLYINMDEEGQLHSEWACG